MKRILIVEDEKSISEYIKECTLKCFDDGKIEITQKFYIEDAFEFLKNNKIDILLLDLNLSDDDGFEILHQLNANDFFTIIISAYKEKAIEAFEIGVVDFISKPFKHERLQIAFNRCIKKDTSATTKFLTVKKANDYYILKLNEINYFEAADVYVEAICYNGKKELLNQSMKKLKSR